jgi:hypothetical protein
MLTTMKFKRKLSFNDFLIIITNLVPVYGVWFEGWSATEAFIVYALETIIIGLFTILKLLMATLARKQDTWYNGEQKTQVSGFFFIFFFFMHFGLFALVQMSIFAQSADINPPGAGMTYFFFHWWEFINRDIAIMLFGFILSYFMRSFYPFVADKYYQTQSMTLMMFQPYGRIFIQQFTVIIGSMFLTFHGDKIFILIFALIKIVFELYFHFEAYLDKSVGDLEKLSPGKQTEGSSPKQ